MLTVVVITAIIMSLFYLYLDFVYFRWKKVYSSIDRFSSVVVRYDKRIKELQNGNKIVRVESYGMGHLPMLIFALPDELAIELISWINKTQKDVKDAFYNTKDAFVLYEISCSKKQFRILNIMCFGKYQKLLNFNTESIPEMSSDFSKWYDCNNFAFSQPFYGKLCCDDLCRK
jgi:hypothetical protein